MREWHVHPRWTVADWSLGAGALLLVTVAGSLAFLWTKPVSTWLAASPIWTAAALGIILWVQRRGRITDRR